MSLLKTLAKVAIGVAVAKGVSSMTKKSSNQTSGGGLLDALTGAGSSNGGGGLLDALTGGGSKTGGGGLLDALTGAGNSGSQSGGLEGMLGSLLGGGQQQTSSKSRGGLGGLLDGLSDASTPRGGVKTASSGGGLDSILDGLASKNTGSGGLADLLGGLTKGGGDLGGLLGGLLGAGAGAAALSAEQAPETQISFGDKFNQALTHGGEPEIAPTPQQEMAAGLMLRAMIQAAKSDGKIDDSEREKLLGKLGDVSTQERDFVNAELAAEIDVAGLAQQVPNGMEAQVYAMSIMGIDLDNQTEAQYLHDFATKLGIDQSSVNHIHDQLGVPRIYS